MLITPIQLLEETAADAGYNHVVTSPAPYIVYMGLPGCLPEWSDECDSMAEAFDIAVEEYKIAWEDDDDEALYISDNIIAATVELITTGSTSLPVGPFDYVWVEPNLV